jgi:predicted HAD superfamily Cof-like phosphohydrolase
VNPAAQAAFTSAVEGAADAVLAKANAAIGAIIDAQTLLSMLYLLCLYMSIYQLRIDAKRIIRMF